MKEFINFSSRSFYFSVDRMTDAQLVSHKKVFCLFLFIFTQTHE